MAGCRGGIRCWLDEHQLLPGDDLHEGIGQGIRLWNKVLLCVSEPSLTSWWVDGEINRAFQKEAQIMKERGKKVLALIPLNLDGFLFSEGYQRGKKAEITSRVAANFVGWEKDHALFDRDLYKVIRALRTDEGGREKPPSAGLRAAGQAGRTLSWSIHKYKNFHVSYSTAVGYATHMGTAPGLLRGATGEIPSAQGERSRGRRGWRQRARCQTVDWSCKVSDRRLVRHTLRRALLGLEIGTSQGTLPVGATRFGRTPQIALSGAFLVLRASDCIGWPHRWVSGRRRDKRPGRTCRIPA